MIRIRRYIGISILLVSIPIIVWGILPPSLEVHTQEVLLSDSEILPSSDPTVIQSKSTLIIEWPDYLRVGDVYQIRMRMDIDDPTDTLDSETQQSVIVENGLSNLQDTKEMQGFLIESHMDIPGIQYQPSGNVREALYPSQQVMFLWSLRSPGSGFYQGTIWIYSQKLSPSGVFHKRSVLATQRIEMRAEKFLGMEGKTARLLGTVGFIFGILIGFEGLLLQSWNGIKRLVQLSSLLF